MLDIRFIRDNSELVAEKARQKGYDVDVAKLLSVDESRRKLTAEAESIRAERNELANKLKSGKPAPEDIARGKELKESLAQLEDQLGPVTDQFLKLLKAVPNMPAADVPVGASEDENVVAHEWGTKPEFDFTPKSHWEIAEPRELIDKERAAKVAGARFAYIKGGLVQLEFAIIQFVINSLTNEETIKKIASRAGLANVSSKAFVPVLPPAMVRTDVYDAMDRLEPRDDRYKVGEDEDNLWLQGSAEHTLGPMYMNETLDASRLPLRYLGFLTSFRREAGTYGKDTEGIIRMHQFDKLEMESFSKPQDGLNEHLLFVAIQEYLMQRLEIPYRVLQKCTADIGKPNARGIDIEAWMPGAGMYRETHTADFMTDYQTRRLNTRVKTKDGVEYAHTNDATAFALGRTMVAIIENYQTAEGKIKIPKVLQPYMAGLTEI